MTIKFLTGFGQYKLNDIDTLSAAEETALVSQKVASTDLTGGTQYYPQENSGELNRSREARGRDNGLDPLKSVSATAINYTLGTKITLSTRIRQDAAGAVTILPGADIQMIGAGGGVIASLATTNVGSMILIEPIDLNATPKKYLVIKGGA